MFSSILTWLLCIGPALAAQPIGGQGGAPAAPTGQATAEGTAQQAPGLGQACGPQQWILIIAMMAVFYFLLIRPQSKRAKEHGKFVTGLKKGDNVIMNSGIYGTVVGVSENIVTIEIADKVRIRVAKSQIAGYAKNADKALEQSEKR